MYAKKDEKNLKNQLAELLRLQPKKFRAITEQAPFKDRILALVKQ